MASRSLIERIERLPPDKRARVERVVDALESDELVETAGQDVLSAELVQAIAAERESLRRQHGFIETDSILRDLRENGGR